MNTINCFSKKKISKSLTIIRQLLSFKKTRDERTGKAFFNGLANEGRFC
jgi:hypothetical protein